MSYVVGIDIGGSITKIAGIKDGQIALCLQVKATDPIASLFGALGKFTTDLHIDIGEIDHIFITGVGASTVLEPIHSIPTHKVDEFFCIGTGGLYVTELSEAIVVSMGTGTALVHATKDEIRHFGGTGVGGGTLLGLSGAILNIRDINNLVQLVNIANV